MFNLLLITAITVETKTIFSSEKKRTERRNTNPICCAYAYLKETLITMETSSSRDKITLTVQPSSNVFRVLCVVM